MSWKALSCGFAFWMTLASFGSADTIVSLNPSKDNTLLQSTSANAQLSNGMGDMFVGRTNQAGTGSAAISIRRGLIAFDIADNIPAGATVTGGTLTMYDVLGSNGNRTLALHDMLQDWGEGTSLFNGATGTAATNGDATWLYTSYNASNPSASHAWTTPGGDFSPTISGSALDAAAGLVTWSSLISSQMTADIQNWLDHPTSNFGWLLQGDESTGQTSKRLISREATTSPNVPPKLTISYVPVPEPSTALLLMIGAIAMAAVKVRRTAIE